ncbi:hypothetical protein [Streptomyces sp. NPDC127036]|uniref:hypothetical protein n=1 Tax=Streptomyces sp. NPDC127036 TaxID=3347112 RepID=UPI003656A003
MDAFESVTASKEEPVPEQLRNLFNHPDDVKVQKLPCGLPDEGSMAVHFADVGAGADLRRADGDRGRGGVPAQQVVARGRGRSWPRLRSISIWSVIRLP